MRTKNFLLRALLRRASTVRWALSVLFIATFGSPFLVKSARGQLHSRPQITWAPEKVSTSTRFGRLTSLSVAFQSNHDLKDLEVHITPSLAGLVLVNPISFPSVKAYQPYDLTLSFLSPPTFQITEFEGTLQIRSAGRAPRTHGRPLPITAILKLTAAEKTLLDLADDLESGDIERALQRFTASPLNRQALEIASSTQRAELASALRGARLVQETEGRRIYLTLSKDDAGEREIEITVTRNAQGEWGVIAWKQRVFVDTGGTSMYTAKRLLSLIVLAVAVADAHSVPVHVRITHRAMEYLQRESPILACASPLKSHLEIGAALEDGGVRWMFHFYPKLDVDPLLFPFRIFSTCTSKQWGFSANTPCFESILFLSHINTHTWSAALANAQTTMGWVDLGYFLHLVEDLTSPAHVRNDAHVFAFLGSAHPYWGDPLEADLTRHFKQLPPPNQLTPIANEGSFFDELQKDVENNFFSNDTCFDLGPGPQAVREDSSYFYDDRDRRIAYKGWRYKLIGDRGATIDSKIADEQWEELGPKAVLAVASLSFPDSNLPVPL